jgi:hypothetical protein
MIASAADPDQWRQDIPALEPLPLPVELRTSNAFVGGAPTAQFTRAPHDSSVPKDRAIHLAAGSVPMARNEDGSLLGGFVGDPFGGDIGRAAMPRTDAEDRAARKKVAAEIDKEDAANDRSKR